MRIGRGFKGGWYLVFKDSDHAWRYYWLFGKILRMRLICFGELDNGYAIWDREYK